MATKTIPAKTIVICDACGKECQTGERRHNARLTLKQDALDYQGSPCADATSHFDLCDGCLPPVREAVNEAMDTLRGKEPKRSIPANALCFFQDGDQWCCVYGDFKDLQWSPAGFGKTFEDAMESLRAGRAHAEAAANDNS